MILNDYQSLESYSSSSLHGPCFILLISSESLPSSVGKGRRRAVQVRLVLSSMLN